LLGVERIRREDDFFALGGHSLMATRLIARIRQKIGIEISLLSLFENPTVSGLARTLAEASSQEANGPEPSLRRLNRG
jgi:acyl carrier protein